MGSYYLNGKRLDSQNINTFYIKTIIFIIKEINNKNETT
jgi:hypothetical protein